MKTLVYGAYGYTGKRIAQDALDRGLDIVVAGRNGTKTRGLGIELGVDARVAEPAELASELDDIDAVLNCAGPFAHTAEPVVDACLDTETAYLDITGEIPVVEMLAERDRDAEAAGVPLLPSVGFDVVPTDCLACHLHDRLPGADSLTLGVETRAGLSRGTLETVLEHARDGGAVRRDGALESVPVGSRTRQIDFGTGSRTGMLVPLPDVSTAYYTTGIPDIETYVAAPDSAGRMLRLGQPLLALLAVGPVRRLLQRVVRAVADDPPVQPRERDRVSVWGAVTDGDRTAVSRLETPEPYSLTVDAATTALERLDAMAELPTGFETPAVAFDAEFVLGLDRVEGFDDEPLGAPETPTSE
ncbi:saccharopine dehydrogenase family protein [Halovenus salina]|uniref:Saccharopine dehydrogenase family protein n=1 Tax=Halovenus salina TaxID=1510225 RepID=A0ABD5W1K8_9EURY|nr:saccharopine dehydrogenase NADP-binding domain-containing protein [Halovenus salina]